MMHTIYPQTVERALYIYAYIIINYIMIKQLDNLPIN